MTEHDAIPTLQLHTHNGLRVAAGGLRLAHQPTTAEGEAASGTLAARLLAQHTRWLARWGRLEMQLRHDLPPEAAPAETHVFQQNLVNLRLLLGRVERVIQGATTSPPPAQSARQQARPAVSGATSFTRSERLVRDIRHWRQVMRRESVDEQAVQRVLARETLTRQEAERVVRQERLTRRERERVETVIRPAQRVYRPAARLAPAATTDAAGLPVPPGYTAVPGPANGARPPASAPSLPDVTQLTEQVIQQIDARILARRERMGGD